MADRTDQSVNRQGGCWLRLLLVVVGLGPWFAHIGADDEMPCLPAMISDIRDTLGMEDMPAGECLARASLPSQVELAYGADPW